MRSRTRPPHRRLLRLFGLRLDAFYIAQNHCLYVAIFVVVEHRGNRGLVFRLFRQVFGNLDRFLGLGRNFGGFIFSFNRDFGSFRRIV
jgi:hypothetical protein